MGQGEATLAEQIKRKLHCPGISNTYFNIHVKVLDSTERIKLRPADFGYSPDSATLVI